LHTFCWRYQFCWFYYVYVRRLDSTPHVPPRCCSLHGDIPCPHTFWLRFFCRPLPVPLRCHWILLVPLRVLRFYSAVAFLVLMTIPLSHCRLMPGGCFTATFPLPAVLNAATRVCVAHYHSSSAFFCVCSGSVAVHRLPTALLIWFHSLLPRLHTTDWLLRTRLIARFTLRLHICAFWILVRYLFTVTFILFASYGCSSTVTAFCRTTYLGRAHRYLPIHISDSVCAVGFAGRPTLHARLPPHLALRVPRLVIPRSCLPSSSLRVHALPVTI